MSYEKAIVVSGLTKCYKIYDSPSKRMLSILFPRLFDKSAKESIVLQDVSFNVKKGETVGIMGRNGAGKSTLLQIISGILKPTEGDVVINGKIMALLELGSGLNREYTGYQNIELGAAIWGYSDKEINYKRSLIVEFSELGKHLEDPIKTYSTGMLMRLAFSIAIHFDPDILIIDEALSVGDELFQAKCFRKIEELKNNGLTILFVSHSMFTINKICDRAVLLHNGRIVKQGVTKDVTEAYNKLLYSFEDIQETAENTIDDKKTYLNDTKGRFLASQPGDKFGFISEVGVIGNDFNNLSFNVGERVVFYCKLNALKDIHDLIMGMMITTPIGVDCYHTNLLCKDMIIDHAKSGEEFTVEFEFPLWLNPGKYIVVFDAQYDLHSKPKLVDIVYEALYFEIPPTKRIEDGGVAALNSNISLR